MEKSFLSNAGLVKRCDPLITTGNLTKWFSEIYEYGCYSILLNKLATFYVSYVTR